MYNTELWITDKDDIVCHGYYGDIEKYKILKRMIRIDSNFINKIKRVSIGLWLSTIMVYSTNMVLLPTNDEWYVHALKLNGLFLKYIKNPTYGMCVEAVKITPSALKYVQEHHQTYELCFEVIMEDMNVLQYVINQTEELILNYIDKKKYLCDDFIKYVKNPTENIYVETFKKNKECMKFIKYE